MPTPLTDALIADLVPRLADTAYTLERTERGFDVRLDLADAKWWMPLGRSGLKQTFVYQVHVLEDSREYSVNDQSRSIEWTAGVDGSTMMPRFGAAIAGHSGSSWTYQRKVEVGVSDQARVEPVVDIAFDSTAVKKQIRDAARIVGLKRLLSRDQRIGIGFGIGGLVFAVLAVAVPAIAMAVTAG